MSYKRREHWSIGEVLNLLQEEFPEVTISKIRFLEGQGLIDPERTPSGYRRFYPEDFDRLRWVLIQQRDHYLPLRVIRERLDSGDVVFEEGGPFPETGTGQRTLGFDDEETAETPEPPAEVALAQVPEDVDVDAVSDAAVIAAEGTAPGPATATPPDTATPPAAPPAGHMSIVPVTSAVRGASASPRSTTPAESSEAVVPEGEGAASETANEPPEAGGGSPEGSAADVVEATPKPEPPAKKPEKTPVKKQTRAVTAPVVALTRDELLSESGCTSSLLNDLERHGLIHGRKSGSSIVYDADAVAIAQIGIRFANHGLDPRHLRSFRLSAEREVGLFAQIVGPQFHRRSPEARQESLEVLDDLTELAESLRFILVTQLLKAEFPGT